MLKEISPFFQTITNGVMTGTTVLTSLPTNISYKDTVDIHSVWTGTPNGTFTVQGSLNYNPGLPQSGGAYNAGNWETVPVVDSTGVAPAATGSASQALINLEQLGFPWIRLQYTNSSSTGVLNSYIFAKSLG